MRLCDRVNKLKLVAGIAFIGLTYVLLAIYFDMSLETWRTRKFNFAIGGSDQPAHRDEKTLRSPEHKKILFWTTMFDDKTFYFGEGDVFEHCPGVSRNCWATHNRKLIDVEEFDALLMHHNNFDILDIPKIRKERQRYVFVNLESPENRPTRFQELDENFFNITMTYRLDSDVVWSYADVIEVHNGIRVAPKGNTVWSTRFDEATGPQSTGNSYKGFGGMNKSRDKDRSSRKKNRTAAWVVSNCNTRSKRENYVDELARHVDVDIFGSCGANIDCPKDRDCIREVVEPNYYFYLSFENSMCQDYVTEKFYNTLKHDVVPVVYGGADYSRFAPPKSYINALDFDSPSELAEYLKRLIREPKEYEKYFEWKNHYKVVSPTHRVICDLCQYLHEHNTTKSYSSLSAWYEVDKCPLQEKLKYSSYLTKQYLTNR